MLSTPCTTVSQEEGVETHEEEGVDTREEEEESRVACGSANEGEELKKREACGCEGG